MSKGTDKAPVLVWFRHDLRLDDHPALAAAIKTGQPIVPVYIWSPDEEGEWSPGGASRWWLHHALGDLREALEKQCGARLILRKAKGKGGTLSELKKLCNETGADAVFWNRRYEPAAIKRDSEIKSQLRSHGINARSENGSLLFEPTEVSNKSGAAYQVFTPFWKCCLTLDVAKPVQVDVQACRPWGGSGDLASVSLEDLQMLPSIAWDGGFYDFWGKPSRQAAVGRLESFLDDGAIDYQDARDLPAMDGTTRLSPALHFGQIGPRELWHAFAKKESALKGTEADVLTKGIMRQLVWREFAHHLLYHFPETPKKPLRPEFELFPWEPDEIFLTKWQRGETGYPIVDAGMRQLWQTGWMHNRVRMIVGSLLVKHLLQHWIDGARWFWDTLVDADLANNTMGWQWIGGCGADAAPYFRIFNPITQGERFDPKGDYVKRYIPELAKLPAKYVHKPWELGELDLAAADVTLGKNYPLPVMDHSKGRQRALDAFDELKRKREAS